MQTWTHLNHLLYWHQRKAMKCEYNTILGTGSNMFEWLEQEISTIKTPKFHLVDGPADPKLEEAVTKSGLPLPKTYMEFVLKFGNAKLYRRSQNGYRIGIFAGPREAVLNDGTRIYHLGFHDGATVYVKPPSGSFTFPIFEFELDEEEKAADDFEAWLTASCARARKSYGKTKWAEILRGPKPFTQDEQNVIEARRQFSWRVVGIDAERNHIFEVTNAGNRMLPVLTIGLRSKDKQLNGAIRLKVGNINPGQTAMLHADCYKDLKPADEMEAFELPDPQPEDRDYYHEFDLCKGIGS